MHARAPAAALLHPRLSRERSRIGQSSGWQAPGHFAGWDATQRSRPPSTFALRARGRKAEDSGTAPHAATSANLSTTRDDTDQDDDEINFEAPIPHRTPLHSLDYKPLGVGVHPGVVNDTVVPIERVLWSKVKRKLRPTQAALGWDWVFYKLQNFQSQADAERYMASKPVPYVQRGSKKYIVDHHHTLVALELSGFDVEVTLEQVRSFDKNEQSIDAFWGYMEGRGWSFLRDSVYTKLNPNQIPKDFDITNFRNDLYRSIGGFLRVYDVLKRGKTLEDTLFFEFRWGYFVWLHRQNNYGLWTDPVTHRAFLRTVELLNDIDDKEYQHIFAEGQVPTVEQLCHISREVTEPAYQMLCYYVRYLCCAYDDTPKQKREAFVPGLKEVFGSENSQLPGKVIR